ncbi:hypothetical protein CRG98_022461 [Punica granatum]|uniref:Uncharacterized protein n=1 Tax=Punica granatum TaxID=22663 RepID=A0A2I0JLL3_PUNGR|nr:hypothetical protein CRG98_022461 [Punica granatum]
MGLESLILLGLKEEPLILARSESLTVSTTDELTTLLLGHESRWTNAVATTMQQSASAPLSGLLGSSLVKVHYMDGRQQKNSNEKNQKQRQREGF